MRLSERVDTVRRDLIFAWRGLRRSPAFALTVIATLSLGIGANTAIFSFVNGVLLRPLAYRDDTRLATLWTMLPKFGREAASVPDYQDWKLQGHSFASMSAVANASDNLVIEGSDPERIKSARVLADFFATLGVTPLLGRDFNVDEYRFGSEHVAVLSEQLWRRRFHADPAVIGKTIRLNASSYQVVGVVPAGVAFPGQAELWAPLAFDPVRTQPRRGDFLQVVGRLRPGVTLKLAQAEMNTVGQRLARAFPGTNRDVGIAVEPLRTTLVGDVAPALLLLSIAVGFVLLIACANIANLLLARATGRQREMAVRVALGASRVQLAYYVLLESLLLSVLGGLVGISLAWCGVRALKATAPTSTPLLDAVRIDGGVLLFTIALTLCTGLAFGIAPALRASRLSLRIGLSEGAGSGGSARSERLRRALVTVQVALALALLSGAGLFVRSLIRLEHVDLGFNERNVLTARVAIPAARYATLAEQAAFFDQLRTRVATVPGVQQIGFASDVPLGSNYNYLTFDIMGRPAPGPNEHSPDVVPTVADSAYFGAMGMTLSHGRIYGTHDDLTAPAVGVVNEEFARRYLSGQDPIGTRISFGGGGNGVQIIGVVKTTRLEGVGRDSYPQIFTPVTQGITSALYLVVRTTGDPLAIVPAVRRELSALDRTQPLSDVRSMQQRVDESIGQTRLDSTLLTGISVLALLIAALGIYGVVAYGVARRTREIGVRLALGASASQIIALIARQGMVPVLLGVGLGLGGSVVLGRISQRLLFATGAMDAVAFSMATLLLAAIAFLACLLPAARASRVSPSIALRAE